MLQCQPQLALLSVDRLTNEVAVVIFDPPDAPVTSLTLPDSLSTRIAGLIEEIGLFPVLQNFNLVCWSRLRSENFAVRLKTDLALENLNLRPCTN